MIFNNKHKNKKSQGMPLTIIIIAVIALIILVVLIMIFTGKTRLFGKQVKTTEEQYDPSKKCEIPGTDRECMYEDECIEAGGYWDDETVGLVEDCYLQGGCCIK